jgi:Fic family protein
MSKDVVTHSLPSRAGQSVQQLTGYQAELLPNPNLFVGMYVKQEAVLSSQIEGTQASLTDILQFEAGEHGDERLLDVEEVVNYVKAMNHGLGRLEAMPLSLRLIREIHGELMAGVRGQNRSPGEFRTTQNWIGPAGCTLATATFVPPPPQELPKLLGNVEQFLHDELHPPLLIAGLAHAQFETIHPFLDGNGRIGRLLITFLLCERKILNRPLLYLSYFLKQHRSEYYDRLQAIRTDGRWEEWLVFFLRGIRDVAIEATDRARRILALRTAHQQQLAADGRGASNQLRAHDILFEHPIVTANSLAKKLGVSYVTANNIIARLEELKLLEEQTGLQRNRRFRYAPFLNLFEAVPTSGDEP